MPISAVSWERMSNAVENVRKRLLRAVAALDSAHVPYAVVGGNAVAAWVSRVDEAGKVKAALASASAEKGAEAGRERPRRGAFGGRRPHSGPARALRMAPARGAP